MLFYFLGPTESAVVNFLQDIKATLLSSSLEPSWLKPLLVTLLESDLRLSHFFLETQLGSYSFTLSSLYNTQKRLKMVTSAPLSRLQPWNNKDPHFPKLICSITLWHSGCTFPNMGIVEYCRAWSEYGSFKTSLRRLLQKKCWSTLKALCHLLLLGRGAKRRVPSRHLLPSHLIPAPPEHPNGAFH